MRFFFALAFVSFPFVYGLGDNSKEDNAKRKTEVCYVEKFLRESNETKFAHSW